MTTIHDLWSTVASDPVTLAAALMMAAALLALALIATPARTTRADRRPLRRPAQARSLAARGAPSAEIARRTGLSRDAVALVLSATPSTDTRQTRPTSARNSGSGIGRRMSRHAERRV